MAKPGIVYGNCITATAGFLLASRGHVVLPLFAAMLSGIALVMASGCVFNNYIDRGIDEMMDRTRKRALVQGLVSVQSALAYGAVLGVAGLTILLLGTNLLALGLAVAGLIIYVGLYGYWKRRSVHGTVVGSLAGAVPPVVGYCAVTNRFDLGAWLLLLILVLWQMPHFYAIAMFRLKDYQAAQLPVLPVKKGVKAAQLQAVIYICFFIVAAPMLTLAGYTGYTFAVIVMLAGLAWLGRGLSGWGSNDASAWGRRMFGFSLIVILALSVMLSVGAALP